MAIGVPDHPLVSGLTPTAPVTGPANVISPDAVNNLVDSFSKGVITGDDLAAHTGFMAYARNRAEAQKLQEETSPSAVQARESQRQAVTSQNQLAATQANAGTGLVSGQAALSAAQNQAAQSAVPGQSALIQAQNEKARAEVWDAKAEDMYREYNPPIYKEDGTTQDHEAMKEAGRNYVRANQALQYAAAGLAAKPSSELDPKTGQPIIVQRNSLGEDVTAREDNPSYTHYRDLRQKATEILFSPTKPHATRGAGTGEPSAPAPAGDSLVQPAATPPSVGVPAPVVTAPDSAAPVVYQSGMGNPSGPVPGTTVPDVQKFLNDRPDVADWRKSQGVYSKFHSASMAAQTGKAHSTANDLDLAESYAKLVDPNSSLREFKWDAIKNAIPWIDTVKDAKDIVTHQHLLPESFRSQLIQQGHVLIDGHQRAVEPAYKQAFSINPGALDEQEKQIARGVPFSQRYGVAPVSAAPATVPPPAPAANSGVVILKTGPYAGYKYDPSTGTVSQ